MKGTETWWRWPRNRIRTTALSGIGAPRLTINANNFMPAVVTWTPAGPSPRFITNSRRRFRNSCDVAVGRDSIVFRPMPIRIVILPGVVRHHHARNSGSMAMKESVSELACWAHHVSVNSSRELPGRPWGISTSVPAIMHVNR